jgi:hypothetical protein
MPTSAIAPTTFGSFMTADPYQASARSVNNPSNPASWNRYAYVIQDGMPFC